MNEFTEKKLIRDGDLVAEVKVDLRNDHEEWGPTMSKEDAFRIDDVRNAMRRKDYRKVAELARLYRLTPVEHTDLTGTDGT